MVQGGESKNFRKQCAEALVKLGFDGLGYGARPVNSRGEFLFDILKFTAEQIPNNYIRFGLGMGRPEDIVRSVKMGWDIFDCVIPSREGRHGRLFAFQKKADLRFKNLDLRKFYNSINITNSKFKNSKLLINPNSKLPELRGYTMAYLHYLFKIKEPLAQRLATLNNLEFYLDLMTNIRYAIKSNNL